MSSKSSKQSTTTSNPQATAQYNSAVASLGGSTYKPLTGSQINDYQSPFTSSVIDATLNRNNQNREMALNNDNDAAIKAGAFDTTGLGVERALTKGQYDLNDQQVTADLNNAGYSQALQTAQSENTAKQQYPLLIQQLLGQLAQGTTQNSTSKGSQMGAGIGWSSKNGFSVGG